MERLKSQVAEAAALVRSVRQAATDARRLATRRAACRRSRALPSKYLLLGAIARLMVDDLTVLMLVCCLLWRRWARDPQNLFANAASAALHTCAAEPWRAAARDALRGRGGARLQFRLGLLIAEARVALWLLEQNVSGVAVTTATAVARLQAAWPSEHASWLADRFLNRVQASPRSRKAYAKAFRRRWTISWRRLPARADMQLDELLQKARPGQRKRRVCGPVFGAAFGTHFWVLPK